MINKLNEYLNKLEKLRKENPEAAKIEAHNALVRIGIIDEDGNLIPPYNGQKIHETDFEIGPKAYSKTNKNSDLI